MQGHSRYYCPRMIWPKYPKFRCLLSFFPRISCSFNFNWKNDKFIEKWYFTIGKSVNFSMKLTFCLYLSSKYRREGGCKKCFDIRHFLNIFCSFQNTPKFVGCSWHAVRHHRQSILFTEFRFQMVQLIKKIAAYCPSTWRETWLYLKQRKSKHRN